jgi:hypothetical protein
LTASQVDPELERKLCNVVAVQLEDQSGDISGLAVKWCVGAAMTAAVDFKQFIKRCWMATAVVYVLQWQGL